MRTLFVIAFSLIIFSAQAQRLTRPDYDKCKGLKKEGESSVIVEGDSRSICEKAIDNPTAYNRCMCQLSKDIAAFEASFKSLKDRIVAADQDLNRNSREEMTAWTKYLGMRRSLESSENFSSDKAATIVQLQETLRLARQSPALFNILENLREQLPEDNKEFQKPYKTLADYTAEVTRLEQELLDLQDYQGPLKVSIGDSPSLSIRSESSGSSSESGSGSGSGSNSGSNSGQSENSNKSSGSSTSSSSSSSSNEKSPEQMRRETKALQEAQRQQQFNESVEAASEAAGQLIGAGLVGLFEMESFEYMRFAYGFRQREQLENWIENDRYPVSLNSLEMGLGFGHFGFFLGGSMTMGYRNEEYLNVSGYSVFGGLEYVVLYNDNGYDLSLGAEIGYGSMGLEKTHNYPDIYYEDYTSTFYGLGVGVTLFQYLHLSYTYGMFTGEASRTFESTVIPLTFNDGYYSRIGIGIKIGYWYL